MKEFLLFSRTGYTTGNFKSLMEAGRLDIVYQCILTSAFRAHGHRSDVVFHAILNGSPNPPLHLQINADGLRNARVDESSWAEILRDVLNGGEHAGISLEKASLQEVIKEKAADYKIFALVEGKRNVQDLDLSGNALFVVGDNSGLPRKDEGFVLRYGKRLSLGRFSYLAASCIDVINYELDLRETPQ